jgi:hypothetical protein
MRVGNQKKRQGEENKDEKKAVHGTVNAYSFYHTKNASSLAELI